MPIRKGSIGTGTQKVIVVGTVAVSGGGGGVQYVVGTEGVSTGTGTLFIGVNVNTARPIKVDSDGTVFVSGGGGGVQYTRDTTAIGATGTGSLVFGVQATTLRAFKVTSDGTLFVTNAGTQVVSGSVTAIPSNTGTIANVLTVGTLLGTLTISGTVDGTFGAGQSYIVGQTSIAATGTGTLFIGVNSTTTRAIALTATGGVNVVFPTAQAVTAANITVASVTTGTMDVANFPLYIEDATTIGATGSGFLMIGVQATTARALSLTTTGHVNVNVGSAIGTVSTVSTVLGTLLMSQSGTGNVTVANVLQYTHAATNMAATAQGFVSLGMVTAATTARAMAVSVTGAQYVLFPSTQVVTAANVTIASITTGTVSLAGLPIPVYQTHIATQWNSGLVTITTSAAGVGGILKTSAANTVYVTDVLASVDVPMNLQLRSATTVMAIVYLATKGGFTMALRTPMVCTTAQSFTFLPSLSGSASVWAAGYTVT